MASLALALGLALVSGCTDESDIPSPDSGGSDGVGGSPTGPCSLEAAGWSVSSIPADESVELQANATGDCSEATVTFRIREDYGTWIEDLGPALIVDGLATTSWPARWEPDPLGFDGYRFEAWLGDDSARALMSDDLLTSASSRLACGNELDDDGDGLFDGQDPGCANAADNDEGDEAPGHNFRWKLLEGGFLEILDWTTDGGQSWTQVSWDESGRFGPAWVRVYGHTTSAAPCWTLEDGAGQPIEECHAGSDVTTGELTYTLAEENPDGFTVVAESPTLRVSNRYHFHGDVMYRVVELSNLLDGELRTAGLPLYLGALELDNATRKRLRANLAGWIETWEDDAAAANIITYPSSIDAFSPVSVVFDANWAIGQQLLDPLYLPDLVAMQEQPENQFSERLEMDLELTLAAGETRRLVLAYALAASADTSSALEPYRRWFHGRYGDRAGYCPAGPWAFVVTTNYQSGASPMYNPAEDSPNFNPDFDPNRFYPDASGQRMFVDTIVDNVAALELDAFGSWASTVHSRYLTPDGSSNEYNPNIELIDPNIDFGRDFSLVGEYTAAHAAAGGGLFWFARPCAELEGASIELDGDGNATFVPGNWRENDLRDPMQRDRQFERLELFVEQGVTGFYFDAMSCPGDEEFLDYTRAELRLRQGVEIFVAKEGARDRDALRWPQIPILFADRRSNPHSQLAELLTPNATLFGGRINEVMEPEEIDQIITQGYQPIVDNSLKSTDPSFLNEIRGWVCAARPNQQARWFEGCPLITTPSYCP
jgi:hypothetical protein